MTWSIDTLPGQPGSKERAEAYRRRPETAWWTALQSTAVVDTVDGKPVNRDLPKGSGWRYDTSLDAAVLPLLPRRRKAAKYTKARGMTPAPVYVAQFDGGHEVRVSFWTRADKPVDFAQGYNAAMILGRAMPIGGRVEMADGTTLADPHFAAPVDLAAIASTVRLSAKDMRAALASIAGLPCSDQAGTAYQAVAIARRVLGHATVAP